MGVTAVEDPLVALVYRAGCVACGRACCRHAKGGGRQYPFATIADFAKWCARAPYRDEVLTVIAIVGMREGARTTLPAEEAAAWLVDQVGDACDVCGLPISASEERIVVRPHAPSLDDPDFAHAACLLGSGMTGVVT